ncbi:uncharacterized protein LOC107419536 isoform X7 [Ziziphus jujuba]|uniref:Uncharacterized protein LOC107419536 isoform X7 n=1 Tax=Ziziphus jujuba TaxID=326968 RepID=A0ABM4A203_ZIZJJ|nr:uncharacterized protein LOC107419536 isoform X7 [Ziziphus jujuba]
MVFHLQTSYAEQRDDHLCPASSCGNIPNVSYPFRLPTDPPNCWKKRYELSCENNNCSTVLNLYSGKYHVRAIDYDNYTIRLADVNIDKANCFTVPLYSLAAYNFIDESPYSGSFFLNDNGKTLDNISLSEVIIFIKCENPVGGTNTLELEDSCRIELMVMITSRLQRISENSSTNISDRDIHNQLVYGFELSWLPSFAKNDKGDCHVEGSNNMVHCYSDDWRTNTPTILKIAFLVFFVVLGVFLSIGLKALRVNSKGFRS